MGYTEKKKHFKPRYRSLFWPMLLIGIGTVWILYNAGLFTEDHLSVIYRIWPLVFVAIGVDLLFGRKSPSRGATVGLAFVGFVLALMYVGPTLNLHTRVEYTQSTFDVPMDSTDQLNLEIHAGMEMVNIRPLVDSNELLEADIWHRGELTMDITQNVREKTITVKEDGMSFDFGLGSAPDDASGWNFLINPEIPLAIDFDGGIGETTMDLSPFVLTDLKFNMGVGVLNITLPDPQSSYTVDINGEIGEVIIDVPDGVAVIADISTGVGDVKLPSDWKQVEGNQNDINVDGKWQSPTAEDAENVITILFDGGIGSFELK